MAWPITTIVAVYGAILSTISIGIHIFTQLISNRPKVKVKIYIGFVADPLSGKTPPVLFISALNPGQKVVTLSSAGLVLPDKNQLVLPNPYTNVTLPHELLPGKSCHIWIETKEIAKVLKANGFSGKVRLVGFYRDQIDKTYKSKPYRFDVDYWAK